MHQAISFSNGLMHYGCPNVIDTSGAELPFIVQLIVEGTNQSHRGWPAQADVVFLRVIYL
jgi:hypothetical protein